MMIMRKLINDIAREHAALFPRYTDAQIAKHLNRDIRTIAEVRKIVYAENAERENSAYRLGFSGSWS